ncbi:LIVCS family branched-chain amino acid:cation transporter [Pedobacter sp. CAN_A7]|uniref:branched-chain amino acid transport system II carrier protein n=1 Tax=Pedobacter sp. CAN_A7 TaxID=2787722 RepID=UPI0018CA2653
MKGKRINHIITIGFALFAMFFGAGNLLLPPFIGLQVSDSWFWTTIGFMITTVILPFLGIISVVLSGDSFTDLGNRVNKNVGVVLGIVIMLGIGPLIAIPRTAATTFEIGILPHFPTFSPIIASIVFFIVTGIFSLSSSKVVDLIGNYLTPLLILILFGLIVMGLINASDDHFVNRYSNVDSFLVGFQEGYQTLDVLASVIFAGIIISAAKLKGYHTTKQKNEIVIASGLLAALFLLFIYGGLVYLGATSGSEWSESTKRAPLLLQISINNLGINGTYAMAICIALACLTTAIALTSAVGSFFSELVNHKVGYKKIVISCCVISCVLSITGVDNIITYAYPFLSFIYPIVITLVLYIVFFGRFIKSSKPYLGAVIGTSLISLVGLLHSYGLVTPGIDQFIKKIPLANYDLAWILPSFVLFVLFFIIEKMKKSVS